MLGTECNGSCARLCADSAFLMQSVNLLKFNRTRCIAVAAAGMENYSRDKLQLGESSNGVLGPLHLAAGSPDDHFNVYIYVRIFDSLQSFALHAVTPVQVIRS